ncbi:TetR/AcrR family transcriptional regulator [Erythrobacter litoralis]|uniref:TetR/AcrR family transcriptional regulator n=1 Tax=Erythrobacter litoralis TaxID=39960 RepID=UPI0024356888|nr:TetR/AcrR family transcriptional regulator [Erythrobacter litoralis]MDG6078847.1 TetR/AcrR family transcriptional regulator [Erythrobacter litoralis]
MTMARESDRAQQMLSAAEALMRDHRSLGFSLNEVAERVGVTRSLLYAYFDGVPAILDQIFQDHLQRLEDAIRPIMDGDRPYRDKMVDAYVAYLVYLVEAGPILQILLRERQQDNPLGEGSRRGFQRFLRYLARHTTRALTLEAREAFVLLELNAAIPEALARLVRAEEIEMATARDTCSRLISASLDAFAWSDIAA